MTPAIEIQNLTKTYKKGKGERITAVDHLSLTVPAGKVLGFLGPNGAGKTTTIKMICGLVRPDDGAVKLNGYDVSGQRRDAMRQIGAVLEGTRNIYWRLNAWQNLLYFGRLKGSRGPALKQRAEQLLKELELWDRRFDPVGQFSRGMQQKVAIAAALVADPPIVLLDEPTLGLDVQAARTIRQWVKKLSQERGKTIVLTTHHLEMAQDLCDQVNIIHKGHLVTNYAMSELLALYRQDNYEVTVRGEVAQLNGWQERLTVTRENGNIIISGGITSQEMLHAVLNDVQGANMTLVSVKPVEPNLEDIFVEVVEGRSPSPRQNVPTQENRP